MSEAGESLSSYCLAGKTGDLTLQGVLQRRTQTQSGVGGEGTGGVTQPDQAFGTSSVSEYLGTSRSEQVRHGSGTAWNKDRR